MSDNHNKLIILGYGPAGYAASIYSARAGLNPIIIAGMQEGGQLTTTTDVENWPGDSDGLQGPELMDRMKKHAQQFDVEVVNDHINKVDLSQRPYKLIGASEYTCDALIITTGASAMYLGLPSEKEFLGKGVSACATCDGFFYKEKTVVVVGGGNTAVEEALFLTNFAKSVILVHRRDKLRCEKILEDRLQNNKKIRVIWDCVVEEISGSTNPNSVEGVNLKNIKTNAIEYLPTDGVFIAIGHQPSTQLFEKDLDMSNGYILTTPNSTETSIKGVFAAGDVTDDKYRQAVTAAGMGCMAALDAEHYLANK